MGLVTRHYPGIATEVSVQAPRRVARAPGVGWVASRALLAAEKGGFLSTRFGLLWGREALRRAEEPGDGKPGARLMPAVGKTSSSPALREGSEPRFSLPARKPRNCGL